MLRMRPSKKLLDRIYHEPFKLDVFSKDANYSKEFFLEIIKYWFKPHQYYACDVHELFSRLPSWLLADADFILLVGKNYDQNIFFHMSSELAKDDSFMEKALIISQGSMMFYNGKHPFSLKFLIKFFDNGRKEYDISGLLKYRDDLFLVIYEEFSELFRYASEKIQNDLKIALYCCTKSLSNLDWIGLDLIDKITDYQSEVESLDKELWYNKDLMLQFLFYISDEKCRKSMLKSFINYGESIHIRNIKYAPKAYDIHFSYKN